MEDEDKVTSLISADSIHINPLHLFVKDYLEYDPKSSIRMKASNRMPAKPA